MFLCKNKKNYPRIIPKIIPELSQNYPQILLLNNSSYAMSGHDLHCLAVIQQYVCQTQEQAVPYLPYVFGQTGLSKQYRPR